MPGPTLDRARGGLLAAALFAAGLALLALSTEVASFATLQALRWRAGARPLAPSGMAAYRGQPWADTFWREQRAQLSLEYHAFGLWRSRPFAGRTIVVDGAGVRRTVHTRCAEGDPKVFLFGGSSVWGYGAPDWETLASHLADRYERDGHPACVVNYGEDSWRTTQGVVQLLFELRRGQRPDLVLFVNGCNDVFTPFFLTGQADVEWDFARAKPWLDDLAHPDQGSFAFVEATNTWALLRRLRGRMHGTTAYAAPQDPEGLARAVARAYLQDVDTVEALGRGYGFRSAFYLQPLALAGGKRLTAEEAEGVHRQLGASYDLGHDAVERTYALLRGAGRPGLRDASGAFDGVTGSVYIDACHFLPEGNRVLADRLYAETR